LYLFPCDEKGTKKSMTAETRAVSYLDFAQTARSRIRNIFFKPSALLKIWEGCAGWLK